MSPEQTSCVSFSRKLYSLPDIHLMLTSFSAAPGSPCPRKTTLAGGDGSPGPVVGISRVPATGYGPGAIPKQRVRAKEKSLRSTDKHKDEWSGKG